jgi:hypothetical protein
MSHEDTNCPCGGKKERETLLCPLCVAACMEDPALSFELARYRDETRSFDSRRSSAIVLLASRRRRMLPFAPKGRRPLRKGKAA